ncbi:hypothetical protein, partial [Desulfosporosinus shakirovi]|uniref:hypothetical protein n=1 Tax=Desulfosporosinus shakirovi TaxID=2885154 RepID=UPI001E63F29F
VNSLYFSRRSMTTILTQGVNDQTSFIQLRQYHMRRQNFWEVFVMSNSKEGIKELKSLAAEDDI